MKKLGFLILVAGFLNLPTLSAECEVVAGTTTFYGATESNSIVLCCGVAVTMKTCTITNNSGDTCKADNCSPGDEM